MKSLCVRLMLSMAAVLPLAPAWAADPAPLDTPKEPAPVQALGVSVGWVYANGLSYRRYLGHNYLQTTLVGYYDKEASQSYLDFSLGAARYVNRFDLEHFAPVGLKIGGGIEGEYRKGTDYGTKVGETIKEVNVGLGFGADIGKPTALGVVLSIDLFYTATFRSLGSGLELYKLRPLPSIGLHYNL